MNNEKTLPEQFDIHAAIERLKAADGSLRAIAALRIAVRALAWYADEEHWADDDWGCRAVIDPPDYGRGGKKARNAIKRIKKQFDPEATPSPVAELEATR